MKIPFHGVQILNLYPTSSHELAAVFFCIVLLISLLTDDKDVIHFLPSFFNFLGFIINPRNTEISNKGVFFSDSTVSYPGNA